MKANGIYKDWIAGEGLEKICKWSRLGMTDKQIAKNIGVTTVTLYDWKRRYPEFAEVVRQAKQELKLELEQSMLDLAMGKAYVEEVKKILAPDTGKVIRIEMTRKQLPPNANLQTFLAKNLMPEKYHPPCWDNEENISDTEGNYAEKS